MRHLLGRLILVPLAFVAGAAVTMMVAVSLGLERMTGAIAGRDAPERIFDLVAIVLNGASLASGLTIVPALAIVLIGEIARIRGWLYYVAGGGLAMVAMPLAAGYLKSQGAALPPAGVLQVLATAGFVGGFIYWMIAGRGS